MLWQHITNERSCLSCSGLGRSKWAKFNPALSRNYSINCFSKEKITVLLNTVKTCFEKILVNPNFTDKSRLFKIRNITMS